MTALTDHERALLDFAKTLWKHRGAREQAITDLFGYSVFRYEQELLALTRRPEALEYAPQLVNRLIRRADRARAARSAKRLMQP